MKQIQMETWHLVNLHTLRCLEHDLPLPDYGKTFFDHCCTGVASTLSEAVEGVRTDQVREDGRRPEPSRREGKQKLVRQIMYACYNVEETDCLEALQMRDVLTPDGEAWREKWIPWPSNIKNNGLAFYIRPEWEFQSVVEARMAVLNEKGVRAFSLFPVSRAFRTAHIVINGKTLAGFVSRICECGEGNLMEDWNMPQVKISRSSFGAIRWTVMRRAFAIDHFETVADESVTKPEFRQMTVEAKYNHASHRFANEIKTDGYNRQSCTTDRSKMSRSVEKTTLSFQLAICLA
ncbi:hypothetical protein L915_09830 [Phytophthora nicotianae]|uniref:Uncharacterized protein n=1 Tax=Phytophthora nicotianae TaxID=4792 RepID=W2GSQ7_PHYNI|nr:hypothetical protein L915_09830 [Phytophthora nicotianae]